MEVISNFLDLYFYLGFTWWAFTLIVSALWLKSLEEAITQEANRCGISAEGAKRSLAYQAGYALMFWPVSVWHLAKDIVRYVWRLF